MCVGKINNNNNKNTIISLKAYIIIQRIEILVYEMGKKNILHELNFQRIESWTIWSSSYLSNFFSFDVICFYDVLSCSLHSFIYFIILLLLFYIIPVYFWLNCFDDWFHWYSIVYLSSFIWIENTIFFRFFFYF